MKPQLDDRSLDEAITLLDAIEARTGVRVGLARDGRPFVDDPMGALTADLAARLLADAAVADVLRERVRRRRAAFRVIDGGAALAGGVDSATTR